MVTETTETAASETTAATETTETTTETTQSTETSSEESTETTQTTESTATDEGDLSSDGEETDTTTETESDDSGDLSAEDGEGGEEDADTEVNELQGVPEEGYADYTLPDGLPIDEGKRDSFNELATRLGLSQKGAQELVDMYAADIQKGTKAHIDAVNNYTVAAKADPEIGGDNFAKTMKLGKDAVQSYGSPAFRQMLADTGLGKHPEMLRTFSRIGKDMSEATSRSGEEIVSDVPPTRAESLYGK